ncbi:class I adenylate-forming enzyme family protein [Sphingomonas astaxanthinifaciens]|uniref:Fatty acid--CoA ligase n=1 Tax=Sphingomonas astaxanthinifaciens DSM 22298 TaxID=1123267 RepID=A0ABQ5Z6Z2_9SPHN|nr:class I adenylate-forming enzyme family protein [Sphingomonas astaxanthinifaciens]GLR46539.1 fatty acid--CoA ligase [Sphingomonas astaxanthinifaciens DSM 22298]
MPSELDQRYDAVLAAVTGPGGRIVVGTDAKGCKVVTNLPATLPAFFRTFCALNAAVEAVIAGEERLTFADLDRWSERLAKALVSRHGVRKGDRVGIAMRNCPTWIVAHMAILKAGGISTLLNGWWQASEAQHALELTAPRLIIADEPRARRIEAGCGEIGLLSVAIERPIGEALAPLLGEEDEGVTLPEIGPDDDATILFTSGSTGDAKGALSTHRAVTMGVYTYATSLMTLLGVLESLGDGPKNPPKTLLNVPLFHVTGEVPVLLNSFVIGRGMVLMPKWDAGEALRLIAQEKITYFVGVPTMSLELMNHPDRDRYDLSTLTDIAAGGAPRPVAHVERLKESFETAQPALGYGLTETNAVGCGNYWGNYLAKPASTGRALPYTEVAILDDGGQQLPRGERGEVGIRAAANIKGYWRNPQATAAAFTADGFFRTGDIGYLDEDGYLFIVDRKKDIIIRGGENISSAEVEAAVYACEAVAEAAVFGAPDERLGEVPVAVVLPAEGTDLSEDELRAFLAPRLAAFKVPERFIFADENLPRLGTGKIDRVALKAQYAA